MLFLNTFRKARVIFRTSPCLVLERVHCFMKMADSLQSLFQAIALAGNERELRHCFMDAISDNFNVQ